MMARMVCSLALAAGLLACSAPGTGRALAGLEAEQQRQSERLRRIQAEIEQSERHAEAARRRAAYQQCRATAAAIDAEVAVRRAACAHEVAAQQACRAKQERDVTDSALGGCGLGLVAGVLSGGALAGWALAGCGTGLAAGEMERGTCPTPRCVGEAEQWLAAAASEHGRHGYPACRAGVDIHEVIDELPTALGITGVIAGTAAAEAGMESGDVLLSVGGHTIYSGSDLERAVAAAPAETPSTLTFLRAGRIHSGRGTIGRQPVAGYGRRLLGIRHRTKAKVRYARLWIASSGEGASLAVGDVILAIDGVAPTDARAAMAAIAGATAAVRVSVMRGDRVVAVEVPEAP